MKVQLLPSVLTADFANLGAECQKVLDCGIKELHIDVMDGHFVPNLTIGAPVLKSLKKSMPHALFDVHLMVTHPLNYVDDFADAGATRLTFHCESESDPIETINAIHAKGMLAGISLRPATPAQAIFALLEKVEMIIIMTVEPGFGGQKFMDNILEKIEILRKEADYRGLHSLRIEIDGGINRETAKLCVRAGANAIVAGNAIYNSPDYVKAIEELSDIPV